MSTQRVLVLCPDEQGIKPLIQKPSLKDVQFSVFQDWDSSAAALSKEHFSTIIAWKIVPDQSVTDYVGRILSLARKTPLILVLAEGDGRSVCDAMKCGVQEILFEEKLGESLEATLEKFLFAKSGFPRTMSIDELFDFSIPVITTTEMNLLTTTILDKLREAIDVSFGIFFREDKESDEPYAIYSSLEIDGDAAMSFLRRFGKSLIRNIVSSPTVIPVEKLKGNWPAEQRPFDVSRFLCTVSFELESGVKMYMVAGLYDKLGTECINNLKFLCRQAHLSLINAERIAQVKSLIYIDDVTKLYNIRYLNVVLDREIKRSERHPNTFSVLFMDIDYFKTVNDVHGHLVGSRVLHDVGVVLKSCVRDSDTVVRYGGDEFVVLLIDTDSEEAFIVAERMRKAVEKERLVHSLGLDIQLTISIGVATFPEHATTKQQLLVLADKAMYRGKESTRNVVYMANSKQFP